MFFFTRTRKLYSSYTRVRPPACLAGASFSLYFIQETIAQTYSKCISGGPHRRVLPPHLYRVGLYFPPAMIYKALLQLITGTEDIFFCNFLVTSSFWSLNVYADNAWWRMPNEKKKKKALGNSTIFAQFTPTQTDISAVFKAALVLHSTASKNQTELKLSIHKAGNCQSLTGFLFWVMEFRSACSVDETMVGFRMDGNECKDFPPFMCLLCDHIAFL